MADALEVKGARELRASMKRAGLSLVDLKDTHATIAKMVAVAAQGAAPRQSGNLAGNIRGAGTNTMAVVRVGGAKVPYANPIHWGWGRRGIAANPFISRAAQSLEPTWTGTYVKAVDDILAKVEGA